MSKQGDALRKARRAQGLCVMCGKPANGKSRCPDHLKMAAESRRRYVARMTPDEHERMVAKEMQRRRLAKAMEVELRHEWYLREKERLERVEVPNIEAKLTPMAKRMLEAM